MKSKWYELKEKAIDLRKRGLSIGKVERELGIPRSTLSGWFKYVQLHPTHKKRLLEDWKKALIKARARAVIWHHAQREARINKAQDEATKAIQAIDTSNTQIIELVLSILYLGEGAKNINGDTAIGNANPLILKFFLIAAEKVYGLQRNLIRCELYLRADQDPQEMRSYWAKTLRVPINNFKHVNIDQRTRGSKTYAHYKGVCQLRCGNVAIQRKLTYLSKLFMEKILEYDH